MQVSSSGSNSFLLYWQEPVLNGGKLISYQFERRYGLNGNWVSHASDLVTTLPFALLSGFNGVEDEIYFRIIVISSLGESVSKVTAPVSGQPVAPSFTINLDMNEKRLFSPGSTISMQVCNIF